MKYFLQNLAFLMYDAALLARKLSSSFFLGKNIPVHFSMKTKKVEKHK
jgi:hypothetical protein